MPEDIRIGHVPVDVQRLMGKHPEVFVNDRIAADMCKSAGKIIGFGCCVVIAHDQVLVPVQALTDARSFLQIIGRKITQYKHGILLPDRTVPITDDGFIHLLHALKRTVFVVKNCGISKMSVRDKVSSFRHDKLLSVFSIIAHFCKGCKLEKGCCRSNRTLFVWYSVAFQKPMLHHRKIKTIQSVIFAKIGRLPVCKLCMSLQYQQKALEIAEGSDTVGELETALLCNNIAMLYQDMSYLPKALDYSLKALTICEKVLGEAHPHTIAAYGNLADIYAKMGANIYKQKRTAGQPEA